MLAAAKRFVQEEDGINTIEIVVLVAILIGLALLFKERIFAYAESLFSTTLDPDTVVPDTFR